MKDNILMEKIFVDTDYGKKVAFVYANFNKKVVTAVLKNCTKNAIIGISKNMNIALIDPRRYKMNEYYTGTEVCQEPDVFIPEVGAALATKKAVDNFNRAYNKRMKKFVNDTKKALKVDD